MVATACGCLRDGAEADARLGCAGTARGAVSMRRTGRARAGELAGLASARELATVAVTGGAATGAAPTGGTETVVVGAGAAGTGRAGRVGVASRGTGGRGGG